MNKSKSLTVFNLLLVMSLTLLIVPGRTSATATRIKPVSGNHSTGTENNQLPPMAPSVVLVGLKPGVTAVNTGRLGVQASDASLNTTFSGIGVQSIEAVFTNTNRHLLAASTNTKIDLSRIYRLRLAPDADVLRVVQELNASPAVAYAEPDYLAHIIATPNDPLYSGQWGLSQINAPAVWDVITGTMDTVIAVIDSGLDTSHPDLAGQLWINPGEISGNGVDDDNNGCVDDIHGWNIVDDDANLSDNTGHGTEVAGVIAAATDNGAGVAGVCWECRLMVVKVTQSGGVANYSDIAVGVAYAAQKGADVINLSLGGYSDSATLRAAIEAASQTAVVVGGAGNDDKSDVFYPAAYDDYVLAVAGTTISDTKVGTSNYGTWVDVSAPGEAITTTFSGGGYGSTSGTSMAAPFASGLAGLLRSQHPDWSANTVRAQIIHTTGDIDGLNPGYAGKLGSGRIDANQAVATAAQPLLSYQSHAVDGETNGRPEPGSTVDLDVTLTNEWADATNVQATLSTSDSYVTLVNATATYGSIGAYDSGTNATSFRFRVAGGAPYAHDVPFTLNVTADGGYATVVPFTVTTASGVEEVSGVISSDTTWTNDKIYVVTGNILVVSGATLTIEPGVTVRFATGRYLQVDGILHAVGTVPAPVIFTSDQSSPAPSDWGGIRFSDQSSDWDGSTGNTLEHCVLEYGSHISIVSASPKISHSLIRYSGNGGFLIDGGAPVIEYNTIVNNSGYVTDDGAGMAYGGGLAVVNNASPTIAYNVISNNTMSSPGHPGILQGGGIYVGDASPYITHNTIESNSFVGAIGQGGGICVHGCSSAITVSNNTVAYNSGGAVRILAYVGCSVTISSNKISSNDGNGLYLHEWGSGSGFISVLSNTVANNSENGIYVRDGSPIISHNAIGANRGNGIYGNYQPGFPWEAVSSASVTYNSIVGNSNGITGSVSAISHNNISDNVDYAVAWGTPDDIDAANNWWGTTNTSSIDQHIHDFYDDFGLGRVNYVPFLTTTESAAPAFLQDLYTSPSSPVGIETVTFYLTFSRSMDESVNPAVTFGATEPYTSYAVLDNAQWITDTVWSATYDITSLVPRAPYTISVSGARGTDGMEIPADTRFGFGVDYAGEITDQTPPNPPSVIVGGKEGDASTFEAIWSASDPDSSITGYRYAIGSAAGATDIVNWTNTSGNSITRSGLGLVEGRQYWLAVQARNEGGLWSASGYSAFVAGQPYPKVFLPLVIKNC